MYGWKSILYNGKELTEHVDKTFSEFHYFATKIVLRLMNNLLGMGHCLFIGNWFSSYKITYYLLQNKLAVL